MDKWAGKVAVVTGASSGIGAAIAQALVHHGLTVVGLARREDRMKKLSEELSQEPGRLVPFKTDLRNEDNILSAFSFIESEFGGASILVNNSGVTDTEKFLDGITEKWREMLEVNVLALCICSREFLRIASKNNLEQGHILNINSVLGHVVNSGRSAVYQASKHAVTAICKSLRKGLADEGSTIKITSISPGFTRSELVKGTKTEALIHALPILEAKDIAQAVISALSTSDIAQVCEMVVTPVPSKKLIY